jgi:hypothetical protein
LAYEASGWNETTQIAFYPALLWHDGVMKAKPEYVEGTEAFERFRNAVNTILTVPKSAIPNPFSKPKPKRNKAVPRKG